MEKDFYSILGVSQGASKEDIKRAWYILAGHYHPDKNNGNDKRFKEANEAYRILSNEESRKEYDSTRPVNDNSKHDNLIQDPDDTKSRYIGIALIAFIILIFNLGSNSDPEPLDDTSTLDRVDIENIPLNDWHYIRLGDEKISQDGIDFSVVAGLNYGQIVNESPLFSSLNLPRTQGIYQGVNLVLNNNNLNQTSTQLQNVQFIDEEGRIYDPVASKYCGQNTPQKLFTSSSFKFYLKPAIPCTSFLLFETSSKSDSFWIDFQYKTPQ